MIALILAAGYGTRLYPLAQNTPKALLPIGSRPILDYLIEKLVTLPTPPSRLVLVSNHKYAQHFQDWFSSVALEIPWQVLDDGSLSENDRLGSMGDLAFAIRQLPREEDLMVLGSDNLFQDELKPFFAFAQKKKPAIALGAYELPNRSEATRYGVLTINEEAQITEFQEKPKDPRSSLVSTAVYFFPARKVRLVLEYVDSERSTDTLGSFIQWLIKREPVFAHRFQGPWFDIGDITSYTHAQESFVP